MMASTDSTAINPSQKGSSSIRCDSGRYCIERVACREGAAVDDGNLQCGEVAFADCDALRALKLAGHGGAILNLDEMITKQ